MEIKSSSNEPPEIIQNGSNDIGSQLNIGNKKGEDFELKKNAAPDGDLLSGGTHNDPQTLTVPPKLPKPEKTQSDKQSTQGLNMPDANNTPVE